MHNDPKPKMPGSRTPASYKNASVFGVLPYDQAIRKIGIGLKTDDGQVLRYALDAASAIFLSRVFSRYPETAHSPRSSGIPKVEGSKPADGQNVCPPARSQAASCGVL